MAQPARRQQLHALVEEADIWQRVHLTGRIGEGTLECITHALRSNPGKNILFNFREVADANSCGIAEWTEAINFLSQAGKRIVFEQCSPSIVNVINLIPAFRGKARVYSVFVPFRCPDCGKSKWALFTAEQNMPTLEQLQDKSVDLKPGSDLPCDCLKALICDIDPLDYFEFLATIE